MNLNEKQQNLESFSNGMFNGYNIFHHKNGHVELRVYDMGIEIESISSTDKGRKTGHSWKIKIAEEDLDFEAFKSKNQSLYEFVIEIDKQQRWSDLIDIIDIHARTSGRATEDDAIKMTWAFQRNNLMNDGKYNE